MRRRASNHRVLGPMYLKVKVTIYWQRADGRPHPGGEVSFRLSPRFQFAEVATKVAECLGIKVPLRILKEVPTRAQARYLEAKRKADFRLVILIVPVARRRRAL